MNEEDFAKLGVGDVVRHKVGTEVFVVQSNYGTRVTAVRTMDMTNPGEWDLVSKVVRRETDSGGLR